MAIIKNGFKIPKSDNEIISVYTSKRLLSSIKSVDQLMHAFKINCIDWHRDQNGYPIYYGYNYSSMRIMISTKIGDCFDQSCFVYKVLIDNNMVDDIIIGGIYSKDSNFKRLPGHYYPMFRLGDKYAAFLYFAPGKGGFYVDKNFSKISDYVENIYISQCLKKKKCITMQLYSKDFI